MEKEYQNSIDNNINKPLDLSAGPQDLGNRELPTNTSSEQNTTNKISMQELEYDNEIIEREQIKYDLFNRLRSTIKDEDRKYIQQAKDLIYRLGDGVSTPPFIINDGDLSLDLINRLNRLDDPELDSVIREALQWIFEPIDRRYFWNVIYKNNLLQWSFES